MRAREEAVSIQLGQPYSEGIRHVIQPLQDGTRSGGRTSTNHGEGAHGRMFAYTINLPPLRAGPNPLALPSQKLRQELQPESHRLW